MSLLKRYFVLSFLVYISKRLEQQFSGKKTYIEENVVLIDKRTVDGFSCAELISSVTFNTNKRRITLSDHKMNKTKSYNIIQKWEHSDFVFVYDLTPHPNKISAFNYSGWIVCFGREKTTWRTDKIGNEPHETVNKLVAVFFNGFTLQVIEYFVF